MISLLLLLVGTSAALHHTCSHANGEIIKSHTHQKYFNNVASSSKTQNIRIKAIYGDEFEKLATAKSIKTDMIEPALAHIMKLVKVKHPFVSPLLIDRECNGYLKKPLLIGHEMINLCYDNCIDVQPFPDVILAKCYKIDVLNGNISMIGSDGAGVPDTDLLIRIDADSECKNGVMAYSGNHMGIRDIETDRPIYGQLTICSKETGKAVISKMQSEIKHKMMHILGVGVEHYAYYRDDNENPRTPRNENNDPDMGLLILDNKSMYRPNINTLVIFKRPQKTTNGTIFEEKAMLVTPNVKREARKHFNCPTMAGMLLEDYGSKSNAYSHFEQMIAYTDLMVPEIHGTGAISRILLALLEDSGWYTVDYSMADDVKYGKGLGCDFVNKNCHEFMKIKQLKGESTFPFCTDDRRIQCSEDRNSVYTCPLNPNNVIGRSDHCPLYSIMNENDQVQTQSCKAEKEKSSKTDWVFEFGNSSKCFDSPQFGKWNRKEGKNSETFPVWGAGCYKYQCHNVHRLLVKINNEKYQCFVDGQILNITSIVNSMTYKGSVTCPRCEDICSKAQCMIVPISYENSYNPNIGKYENSKDHGCNGSSQIHVSLGILSVILAGFIRP